MDKQTRKEHKRESAIQHDMMANHRSSENAKEWFRRPAYQVKRYDPLEYMDKLGCDTKGGMQVGQKDS